MAQLRCVIVRFRKSRTPPYKTALCPAAYDLGLCPKTRHTAVYAILVATALCGIAAPVYALNGEKGDVEPAYMASTVKDRYKAFSGDTFYVAEYDTTYRQLRYNKGYDYLGAEAISYTSGWYRSNYGHITQFKCNYRVYN